MVSAELVHNPYLLETVARFNGREPKVNSAIEKFEGRPLVEWVDEVPNTFRDEMNGLDFDLSFTGTDADYRKVLEAFSGQGVRVLDTSADANYVPAEVNPNDFDVRLTHSGHLEDVGTKRREIVDLLAWLDGHRNRWFDYDEFITANSEVLDGTIPYVIASEHPIQPNIPSIGIEMVDSAQDDLAGTLLTNTPILFMVNPKNRAQFRNELLYVLGRTDVEQRQLFFCIHPSMNRDRAIRVISDLGVENPQVVEQPDDQLVMQYIDDYPSMEYVRSSASIFRSILDEVSAILKEVGADRVVASADRGREIAEIDRRVDKLEEARTQIGLIKLIDSGAEIVDLRQQLDDHILTWRIRKTRVTGHEEIEYAAREFDKSLRGWAQIFETGLATALQAEQQRIEREAAKIYINAGAVPSFVPRVAHPIFRSTVAFPNLIDALVAQTETECVSLRNDILGLFGVGGGSSGESETVEVASYEDWRLTVRSRILPTVRETVDACMQELSRYHAALAEAYKQQLDVLIEDQEADKELLTAMLSDTERLFEEDKDWLSVYEERLLEIERK